MQTYDCQVNVGGSVQSQVPKSGVTAAEIAVIRSIHGDDSVVHLKVGKKIAQVASRAELARLKGAYRKDAVDALFGSTMNVKLPQTVDDLPDEIPLFIPAGTEDEGGE